jgi:hypothetical protein
MTVIGLTVTVSGLDSSCAASPCSCSFLPTSIGSSPSGIAIATLAYWRAMAIRISLSVSVMRSPDRSMVTVCRVPVYGNGAWAW